MTTSETPSRPAPGRFPTFRRLFSAQMVRRYLFVFACLITVIALYYAEENWRGKRSEAAYLRALEARGETLDYRAFVPPAVPDNENFAATAFFAPLFDFIPGTQQPRDTNAWRRTIDFDKGFPEARANGGWQTGNKLDLPAWQAAFEQARPVGAEKVKGPPPPPSSPGQAAQAVLEALKPYDPVLEEIRAASRRPKSRFNLAYDLDNPAAILLPHLAKIKRLCQILELRAVSELELGRVDLAANDVRLMLYLTDSIKTEPIVISHLVRLSCLQLTTQVIWEGLADHKWPEAQLQEWQARFGRFDFIRDLQFSLRAERAWGNRIIDWIRNGSRSGTSFEALADGSPGGEKTAGSVFNLCPGGWLEFEKLNYNRMFEEFVTTGSDAPAHRIHAGRSARNQQLVEDSLKSWFGLITRHRIFARLLLPAIDKIHMKFSVAQSTVDQIIVACALERRRLVDGHYPEKIDVIAPSLIEKIPQDVISGQSLRYRRESDDRFILYSIGWNEADDGGSVVMAKGKSPVVDLTRGDWVWRYPQKAG